MATKKVVIIIVEGLSDSTSLDRYLKMIKKDSKIFYHIIRGDITKEKNMARHTAKKLMGNSINKFFKDNIYGIKKKDVKEIVHLVDLDGTFVSDDLVKKVEDALSVIYGDEDIKYRYNEYLIDKNNQKAGVLDVLCSCDCICTNLPYRVYFFSRNLEHALHGDARSEISDQEKKELSQRFAFEFSTAEEFVRFMNSEEIRCEGDTYEESWKLIKMGINSLKRGSNFHFYINEQLD